MNNYRKYIMKIRQLTHVKDIKRLCRGTNIFPQIVGGMLSHSSKLAGFINCEKR